MRVLLDECVDEELRHYFVAHDCHTCRYAGFRGLTNGQLLSAAERAGFDVLVTVDQNIPYQQNLGRRQITIVVLIAPGTTVDDLAVLIPQVLEALPGLSPGSVIRVGTRS